MSCAHFLWSFLWQIFYYIPPDYKGVLTAPVGLWYWFVGRVEWLLCNKPLHQVSVKAFGGHAVKANDLCHDSVRTLAVLGNTAVGWNSAARTLCEAVYREIRGSMQEELYATRNALL